MKNYPKIYNNDIKVLGRVVSIATENKVAAAEQVFDEKFKYIELDSYSWDNVDLTEAGLDQYTINRLFGKKLKKLDDNIKFDEDGWVIELKVRNLIANNIETDDLTVNNNAEIKNLHITNRLTIKGINIEDLERRVVELENWRSNAERTLTNHENRITHLEERCEEVRDIINNLPTGAGDASFTVSPKSVDLAPGETAQITVTKGADLTGTVRFTSNNANIATVSASGVITAVADGTTTITVSVDGFRPTQDVTVKVTTPTPTYRVTFNPNNRQPSFYQDKLEGEKLVAVTDPVKEGYTFNGWHVNSDTGAVWNFNDPVTSTMMLIAGYTQNEAPTPEYSVSVSPKSFTYDLNGGSVTAIKFDITLNGWDNNNWSYSITDENGVLYNSSNGSGTSSTKTKNTWFSRAMIERYMHLGENTSTVHVTVDGDTTGNEYTDTFVVNVIDTTVPETHVYTLDVDPTSTTITAGNTTTITATPKDNGTAMSGQTITWSSSNTSAATVSDGVVTAITEGTATITASWTSPDGTKTATCAVTVTAEPTYTLTFDTAGGSTIEARTYKAGATIEAVTDPTREGYNFTGWNPAMPETMPAENLTVVAQWELIPIEYELIIVGDNRTVTYGGSPITLTAVKREKISHDVASIEGTVQWSTSKDIVTFTKSGSNDVNALITAKEIPAGTTDETVITASVDGLTAEAGVSVTAEPVNMDATGVTLNPKDVYVTVGHFEGITTKKLPTEDHTGTLSYTIADPTICEFGTDSDNQPNYANVVGKAVGDTTVTVTLTNSSNQTFSDSITVHVLPEHQDFTEQLHLQLLNEGEIHPGDTVQVKVTSTPSIPEVYAANWSNYYGSGKGAPWWRLRMKGNLEGVLQLQPTGNTQPYDIHAESGNGHQVAAYPTGDSLDTVPTEVIITFLATNTGNITLTGTTTYSSAEDMGATNTLAINVVGEPQEPPVDNSKLDIYLMAPTLYGSFYGDDYIRKGLIDTYTWEHPTGGSDDRDDYQIVGSNGLDYYGYVTGLGDSFQATSASNNAELSITELDENEQPTENTYTHNYIIVDYPETENDLSVEYPYDEQVLAVYAPNCDQSAMDRENGITWSGETDSVDSRITNWTIDTTINADNGYHIDNVSVQWKGSAPELRYNIIVIAPDGKSARMFIMYSGNSAAGQRPSEGIVTFTTSQD